MTDANPAIARRPRAFVRVQGPDAADFLERMVSNEVASLEPGKSRDALLLTPKARVIAPLRILRRAETDFLLLTEPELGAVVREQLLRARFAAKVEIEPEEHASYVLLGDGPGLPTEDYGVPAVETLDAPDPEGARVLSPEELELLRIRAATPRFGAEIDDRVLPAEAGLVERAVSLDKGCFPGQEPIARLHYRGHANRALRVLDLETTEPPAYDAEIQLDGKAVGRITSAVRDNGKVLALGYVRVEVPDDAELTVGAVAAHLH
jgi:folate-binding protein YgfZ